MANIKKNDIIIFMIDVGDIKKGTMGRIKEVKYAIAENKENTIYNDGAVNCRICGGLTRQGRMYVCTAYLTFKDGTECIIDGDDLNKIRKADKEERFLFEMSGGSVISDVIGEQ